jgi:type 1 fimbriae regulatory protein FimB
MGSGSPRPAAWCWSRWTFASRVLHDARLKGGLSTTHPLRGDEIGAIKAWLVERTRMKAPGRTFFLSEQRKPLHR